jgi:hypothetical protein
MFLADAKIVDLEKEYVSKPSLVIGGTQNQQCHAISSRLICLINDMNDKCFYGVGYEVNCEAFNTIRADPYAPSIIMTDLSFNNGGFFLNIPTCYTKNMHPS